MDESKFDISSISKVLSLNKMTEDTRNSVNESANNSLLSYRNNMNESAYDKVFKTRLHLDTIVFDIFRDKFKMLPSCKDPELTVVDKLKICLEIDQFIKEYPETNKKYLQVLLNEYLSLQKIKNIKVAVMIPNYDERDLNDYPHEIFDLFAAIDYITEYLTELLTPKTETQKQPKQTATPKGQTQLNRNQTGLLFWYLREKSLILPKAENKNISKAIELMTGHSAGIMDDILKKPQTDVCKLGKGKLVNKNDFDIVITELEKLIIRIKTDRQTNVENGELN